MNKIAVLKKAVTFVIGAGVTKIVNDIVANNVEIDKPYQNVTVPLASFAVGGVVADATSDYTDSMIDQAAAFVQNLKNRKNSAE